MEANWSSILSFIKCYFRSLGLSYLEEKEYQKLKLVQSWNDQQKSLIWRWRLDPYSGEARVIGGFQDSTPTSFLGLKNKF